MSELELILAILFVLIGICIIADNTRTIGFILLGSGIGMINWFVRELYKRR